MPVIDITISKRIENADLGIELDATHMPADVRAATL
jgi:hypothetical protein